MGCLVLAGIPFLQILPVQTVEFDRHFQTYILQGDLQDNGGGKVIKIKDLLDKHPLPLYKLHGNWATVLHHYIDFD